MAKVQRAVLWLAAVLTLAACGAPSETPARLSEAAARGEAVFTAHCGSCHTVTSQESTTAPSLENVIGRTAGSTTFQYSPAMREANIVWTRQTLDQFLTAPRETVPGNQMAFFGMPDAAMRADLIEYIAVHSQERAR